MATQEIPSGNGIKNISIPRSDAYIKIAKKNGSRLLSGRSILTIADSIARISAYIKIAEKNGSRLLPGKSILSIANSIPSVF